MKTSTLQSRRKSWLASCISFVFIIGLFILISSKANDSQIYPSLKQVFQQIGYIFTHQYEGLSFIYTFLRVLFILILAIISSLLISYLYYLKQWTYGFFQPILVIMKSIPVVALAVYMFLLVGSKRGPYFIAYLVALPIMLEGFILGIDSIPQPIQMELALTEVPKWKKFIQIYLPMMKKSLVTAFLQTLGITFKSMIMGEYVCQTKNSIGVLIYDSKSFLEMDMLLAVSILIVIIVFIGEVIAKRIEKKLFA